MPTAGAKNKSRDQSSYAELMAEYRNRMGMDKASRTSSLKMAENPSVGSSKPHRATKAECSRVSS